MTGQSLLDIMEDYGREFQLQAGEEDVTRGLRALNTAQDRFESMLALQKPGVEHIGTVTTAADTETTAYPTGLLRLDSLWFIDPNTSLPSYELEKTDDVGGHRRNRRGLLGTLLNDTVTTARPARYWADGAGLFYWDPIPDAVHTIRWHGFQRKADITAGGTFGYDDGVAEALAVYAVEVLRRGLDDPITDYIQLGESIFSGQLTMMRRHQRQQAPTRQYRYHHDT